MNRGLSSFIVVSGLTRRLVEARDGREARVIFLRDVARATHITVPYDACLVFEATPENVAEFQRGRRAHFDGQLALELGDDNRSGPAAGPRRGRNE